MKSKAFRGLGFSGLEVQYDFLSTVTSLQILAHDFKNTVVNLKHYIHLLTKTEACTTSYIKAKTEKIIHNTLPLLQMDKQCISWKECSYIIC